MLERNLPSCGLGRIRFALMLNNSPSPLFFYICPTKGNSFAWWQFYSLPTFWPSGHNPEIENSIARLEFLPFHAPRQDPGEPSRIRSPSPCPQKKSPPYRSLYRTLIHRAFSACNSLKLQFSKSELVEVAGVEPASENTPLQASTYLFLHKGLIVQQPHQDKRSFALSWSYLTASRQERLLASRCSRRPYLTPSAGPEGRQPG